MEVEPNSPAELADLIEFKDFLLGTAEKVFKNADILFEELKEHIESPIEFYVYNQDSDDVRTVVLMPSTQWGGEGILGASVGSGYLHTIPSKCCQTIGMSQDQSLKGMHSPFGNNAVANNDSVIQPEVPVKQMIENIESKISPTTSPGNEWIIEVCFTYSYRLELLLVEEARRREGIK